MTTYTDLKDYAEKKGFRFIIASDAETVTHKTVEGTIVPTTAPGGVATAFDSIVKAFKGIYIGRGKTEEDFKVADKKGEITIDGKYKLKRIRVSNSELEDYYEGFSNQTMWPLCHVAFERPAFHDNWFDGYKKINERFAKAIKEEIKGKTFIWVNDYQLSLVPKMLNRPKDTVVAMFWHIPWPTWETFRILPQKEEILESLLSCDYLAFHRGYQARNFIETVRREMEARIDEEKRQIHYKGHITTVGNLPMGIDVDVIKSMASPKESPFVTNFVNNLLGVKEEKQVLSEYFEKYQVILGVDRIDYTKGLILRLTALERFFEDNKKYRGKAIYLGIMAPSRTTIPAYKQVQDEVLEAANKINEKFGTKDWKPIHLISDVFAREDLVKCYERAKVCLVTPRDDGMNLVSKEFVVAAAQTKDPGMLVLSEFAGSAMDLTEAIIVNPYDYKGVADAIRRAIEMSKEEKRARIREMEETLEDRSVYQWALDFIRDAVSSKGNLGSLAKGRGVRSFFF